MSLTVAVQMDPIQRIKIAGDSTFALLLEAERRGHRLLHYGPDRLSMRDGAGDGAGRAALRSGTWRATTRRWASRIRMDLAEADVILMRQDPPFDIAYITATHLLERIHPKTLVVNDPASVRNAPEKIFVTHYPAADAADADHAATRRRSRRSGASTAPSS